MFNISQIYTQILLAFTILLIGFWVKSKNKNHKSSTYFLIISIFMAIWTLGNYFANFYSPFSFFLNSLTFFASLVGILSVLLFTLNFPKENKQHYLEIVLMIPVFICGYFLFFTKLIIDHVFQVSIGMDFTSGPYYFYFIGLMFLYIVLIIVAFIHQFRSSKEDLSKKQLKILLISFLIFLGIAVFTNLIGPSFLNMAYLSDYGPFALIVFLVGNSYSIMKYQFLNTKTVLTQVSVYILWFVLAIDIGFSTTIDRLLLRILIFVLVVVLGQIVIKSVYNEIRQKEKLQVLSKQLEQANAHLKELDAMKTEFVSLASHELLTPVSAIEGYLSMLLDEKMARVDDPKAKKYLDNVYLSAKRLARLIADMLNISRIEEGRLSVEKSDVNIGDTIDQVIAEIRFKAEERKQKVVFKREPQANFSTYGDPDKIKEIVINIIGNSIKYSRDPGTVTITVQKVPRQMVDSTWARIEADIKARPLDDQEAIKSAVDPHYRELVGDEQLMISVKDQGVGIPREELPRLFKKFHRVGNYSTQESQGTGLGLYISRALVELQHGRIWADSEGEGKGSTFTFTLPDLAVKNQILTLEKEIPMDKEQMKPLARPMKSAAEEL